MSGYRDRSGFDPHAGGGARGAPQRPYTWVQWTGIVIALIGVAIDLVYLGGRIGIIRPPLLDSPSVGIALPLIGAALLNARGGPLSPESRRQRIIIILVALAICVLVAALVIYSKGA
jgi:hypothetical protein